MDLLKKIGYNAKITEIEGKIPSFRGLVTKTALTAVENKKSKKKVKKTDHNKKINLIENKIADHNHDKYITTSEYNKLTAKKFTARLAKANTASKVILLIL